LFQVRSIGTVSPSIGLAQIIRQDNGAATGIRGLHALKSAFQPIVSFDAGKLSAQAS
jgi:hypothetical protein